MKIFQLNAIEREKFLFEIERKTKIDDFSKLIKFICIGVSERKKKLEFRAKIFFFFFVKLKFKFSVNCFFFF